MNKELKKLSRRELVDLIYQLKKNEQQLQEQIEALEAALNEKRIRISDAGSIAEAAADITDIFSTAQTTADLYLQEIEHMKKNTEKECAKMLDEARRNVKTAIADGKKQYDQLSSRYREDYKKWRQLKIEIAKMEEQKRQGNKA
jgi:cell division septum initiation protein DivIVA